MSYYFDEIRADKAVQFIERYVRHIEGDLAGQRIKLEDWQKNNIIRPLFGWRHRETGLRKYRKCYVEIPRKNGKSMMGAMIVLIMLMVDNEAGAQVYSAAGSRDQARVVFRMVKLIVEADPKLREMCQVFQNSIMFGDSYYKAVSKEGGTQHGFNSHCTIVDEVHVHKTRDLIEAHETSQGSRSQPLMFMITTAGDNRSLVCRDEHDYAKDVLSGKVKDDSYLPVIYAASPEDDPFIEETWKKANPNYGVSVKREFLAQEASRAKHSAAYLNSFKRLYLNVWTNASEAWIGDHDWSAAGHEFDIKQLEGKTCYLGLDFGQRSDASALCALFPWGEGFVSLNWFWLPTEQGDKNMKDYNRYYAQWVHDGHIVETPGRSTNQDYILRDVLALYEKYDVKYLAYDRYGLTEFMRKLELEGVSNMAPVSATAKDLSEIMEKFINMVMEDKFNHLNNPVLAWMVSNMEVREDVAGNILPDKRSGRAKIDGVLANLYALFAAVEDFKQEDEGGSYADSNEVIVI